jgi:hypothetical protein
MSRNRRRGHKRIGHGDAALINEDVVLVIFDDSFFDRDAKNVARLVSRLGLRAGLVSDIFSVCAGVPILAG